MSVDILEVSHDGHCTIDTQGPSAVVGQEFPEGHSCRDTLFPTALGGTAPAEVRPRSLLDPLLTFASITLDDLESQRIALENRYRTLTTSGESEKGLEWGFGLDDADPNVATFGALVDQSVAMEKTAIKNLEKLMRAHPLGPWVKSQRGLGDKTSARLLGIIGDPYWQTAEDRPRTVSELWAYCGLVPGQKRRKGQQSNWSDDAKKRAWLLATSCLKAGGPYREVYDSRRAHTAEKLHDSQCVRCGPSGKPAQPGSPWFLGHQHADALRISSKEILKDFWKQSRDLHTE